MECLYYVQLQTKLEFGQIMQKVNQMQAMELA